MRGDDDLAVIVRSYNFTLIDPATGLVAAELKSNLFALFNSGLQLYHNRADIRDSGLVWSDNAPVSTTATTQLQGPQSQAVNGGAAALTLTADGVSGAANGEMGSNGNNGWGLIRTGHTVPETNIAYLDAYSGLGGLGNYAQIIAAADAAGNSASLNAAAGQVAVSVASTGLVTVLNALGDIRNHGAGSFYWRNAAGSVTLMTLTSAGGLTVAGALATGSTITGGGIITCPGYLQVTGGSDSGGNLRFSAANPHIVSSSFLVLPGGLYINGTTPLYAGTVVNARAGITNDTGRMHVTAGSDGFLQLNDGAGLIFADSNTVADGTYPRLMRRGADGVMFFATSRRATKRNIRPVSGDPGELLDRLDPVEFQGVRGTNATDEEWAGWDSHVWHRGFIAEDVAAVDPWLAQYDLDPETDELRACGWREPDVVALLVAEVKALRLRVGELESRAAPAAAGSDTTEV